MFDCYNCMLIPYFSALGLNISFDESDTQVRRSLFPKPPRGGGYSITFNMGIHANIWGPKFNIKSIFGVCELQHGQNSIFWVHKSEKRKNR